MIARIDRANARFWDELCGTTFARRLGIQDHSLASLRRFDQAYLDEYPYLLERVPVHGMRDRKVLEIGLGYGTLGQRIAEAGADYTGLDIARRPVDMMNHRLRMQGLQGTAVQGSVLECPFGDASMDCIVSIGCFHHTGNLQRCLDESWRMLTPGGRAFLMVYNRYSYLRWLKWFGANLRGVESSESERKAYDTNTNGEAAPETVFVSRTQLFHMTRRFSKVSLRLENTTHLGMRGFTLVPRRLLLPVLGKIAGLDIYVDATK